MGSKSWVSDASASVADLGVLIPLVAALSVGNGLDAATALVGVGCLYLVSGLYFRLPVPVQPIKAAAAVAIGRDLPTETIAAAAVMLGALMVVLAITGAAARLDRVFSAPVVRGLQLGVGLILLRTALGLASTPGAVTTAILVAAVLVIAARQRPPLPVVLPVFALGTALAAAANGAPSLEFSLWTPTSPLDDIDAGIVLSAFVLLVVPQVPLTIGNAVVAVDDLERRYYAADAHRSSPTRFALSTGIANLVAGTIGAMPMCHGSGGLTAHFRAGARSFRMNIVIGSSLLVLGLFLGPAALALLALIPLSLLAGALAFTGLFHASLVASLRGADAVTAASIGLVGLVTTNLTLALAVGLVVERVMRGGGARLTAAEAG